MKLPQLTSIIFLICTFVFLGACHTSATSEDQSSADTSTTASEGDSSDSGFTASDFEDDGTAAGTTTSTDSSTSSSADSSSSASSSSAAGSTYVGLKLNTVFSARMPVAGSALDLSSAFGPRLKASDAYRYDFHRGIDIPGNLGDPLYSIGAGTLYKAYPDGSSAYPNSGNVVVIRYPLTSAINFHGISVTQFYAVYMHLNSFGAAAQAYLNSGVKRSIVSGEVIGYMGQTGDTNFTHLHFEIRLQTTCSLEYQLDNPSASCASYDFDPHVNPMDLFTPDTTGTYALAVVSTSPTQITLRATADPERLNADGVRFDVYDSASHTNLLYSKALDFDLRTGFDATSTDALDNSDVDGFVVAPAAFNASSANYEMDFDCELPDSLWTGHSQLFVTGTLLSTQAEVASVSTTVTN